MKSAVRNKFQLNYPRNTKKREEGGLIRFTTTIFAVKDSSEVILNPSLAQRHILLQVNFPKAKERVHLRWLCYVAREFIRRASGYGQSINHQDSRYLLRDLEHTQVYVGKAS